MTTRIYRNTSEQMLGGVASGLARAWNLDPTLVRAGFVIGALLTHGALFFVYLLLWAVLPTPSSTAQDLSGVVRENVAETAGRIGVTLPPVPPRPAAPPTPAAPPAPAAAQPGAPAAPTGATVTSNAALRRILLLVLLVLLVSMLGGWGGAFLGPHHIGSLFWPLLLILAGVWALRHRR